jgi:hypothetical protein
MIEQLKAMGVARILTNRCYYIPFVKINKEFNFKQVK